MPLRKTPKLPKDIFEKLKELDKDLDEEDITVKGYCKRKWALLQEYASKNIATDVQEIQTSIVQKKVDEKEAYSKMLDLLRIENMFISEKTLDKTNRKTRRKVLSSTENLLQEVNSRRPCCSKPDTSLKNTIIKNFFTKVLNSKLIIQKQLSKVQETKAQRQLLKIPQNTNKRKSMKQINDNLGKIKYKKSKTEESSPITLLQSSKQLSIVPQNINTRNIVEQTNANKSKTIELLPTKTLRSSKQLPKIQEARTRKQLPHEPQSIKKRKTAEESNDNREKTKDKKSRTEEPSPTRTLEIALSKNKGNSTEQTNHNQKKSKDRRPKLTEELTPRALGITFPRINLSSAKCDTCDQYLDSNLLIFKGPPNGAVEEFVALTNPKLLLFTGEENKIHSSDELPHNKITQFTVYDKQSHLCSFDSGLIEKNTLLYFSGYLKPIYDENPSFEGGIPVKDMGPINEWWTSGFDGGKNALVGFSTACGEYYLMEPSKEYKPIMKSVWEKIYLSKIVIEFLVKTSWKNPTYEDLLVYLQTCDPPENTGHITEEDLLRHAQFICEQVTSFDFAVEDDDLFIASSCMRSLVKLAGVTFVERKEIRKGEQKKIKTKNKSKRTKNFTKATTTELVREVFDSFFPEQLDNNTVRRKPCGKCTNCRKPVCGKCKNCINKEPCEKNRCSKIENAEDSETEYFSDSSDSYSPPISSKNILHSVSWLSDPITEQNGRIYYSSAKVGDIVIKPGDCVMLKPEKNGQPLLVAKVTYMWDQEKQTFFHAHLFCRGIYSVLGEISDPREIFEIDECETCPLGSIVQKAEVKYKNLPPDLSSSYEDNLKFFCQKRYDRKRGRFEDIFDDKLSNDICSIVLGYKPCASCKRQSEKDKLEKPVLENGIIKWRNTQFKVGSGVYLLPGTFEFSTASVVNPTKKELDLIDEDMYPEFYRKKSENIIGIEISEPFCIGYILEILPNDKKNIEIKVQKLYRPENTHKGQILSQLLDINLVYWSEEQVTVSFSKVTGKCYIVYGDILDIPVQDWSSQGPNRFYFLQSYNYKSQEFLPVGDCGNFVGRQGKGKKITKSKSKKSNLHIPEKWFSLNKPLKTMDVFAGCGGLSEGLHQSGVADTRWAIENDKTAALAFKLNNPQTLVYSEDCNELLAQIISGKRETNQTLPFKGEVELLVGGPPCQGFSGMNRFNAGQYSIFKNSLIVSYLSYCDYYRPKYFILENVRNFVTFKKSMVLKLTLRCLLAMGYQCAFGVLQAGNCGIPQIRRRSIILAAAPGEILPEYPEPLHVFTSKRANPLDVVIDNCRYNTGSKWLNSGAPYRTITVRDAMSDLPEIRNGCTLQDKSYDNEPLSHFQRLMRSPGEQSLLRDHICKEMAVLVEARISYIPTASGSDWRDLPNIEICLPDGTMTNKLRYGWHDKKNGKNSRGSFRGLCPCASRKPCDPLERQYNTLIPWCLPHTANRHNNWAGLYGRLEWDGVFNTTVTNPEPMGKQGRVLHPNQHRVVSVRECARSQGFPDKYRFYGNVLDKHRQVGNAVPPPMGKAIGREILKSVILTKKLKTKF